MSLLKLKKVDVTKSIQSGGSFVSDKKQEVCNMIGFCTQPSGSSLISGFTKPRN